jgi:hypothetical protein
MKNVNIIGQKKIKLCGEWHLVENKTYYAKHLKNSVNLMVA